MVYVARDGTIYQEKPWGIEKIIGVLYGVLNMILAFFQTMIPIESSSPNNNIKKSGGWRSGGGGGGGGGYPRPGGGRPGGNIRGMDSLPPSSPPACGRCCGS